MNERLYGTEVLIGREPKVARLLVAMKLNGEYKNGAIGNTGSVPDTVSRCIAPEGKAHCKLKISSTGVMILEQVNMDNVTYVNGKPILSKEVESVDEITLGKSGYSISINQLLPLLDRLVVQEGGVSIKHLEKVYNDYQKAKLDIEKQKRKINFIRGLYMPITVLGAAVSYIIPAIEPYRMHITIVGAIILVWGIFKSATDRSIEKTNSLTNKFYDDYQCPNCGHFLGVMPYKLIAHKSNCPNCKCKWIK